MLFVNNRDPKQEDVLPKYLDQLLRNVFNILDKSKDDILTEQCLDAISGLADQSKQVFEAYYDNFVPKLMNVIKNTKSEQLRGQSLQCVSYIGRAVGAKRFEKDAALLMPFMLEYFKNSNLSGDEDMFRTIIDSWPRICEAIGIKFMVYMQPVMEILIRAAKLDCQIQSLDNFKQIQAERIRKKGHGQIQHGLNEQVNYFISENVALVRHHETNERMFHINLLLVETKVIAMQVLRQLCSTLKHLFWPYIPQYWQVAEEAIKTHNGAVRWEGIKGMAVIVKAAIDSMQFSQTADQIAQQLNNGAASNGVANGNSNNNSNNNSKNNNNKYNVKSING